MHYILLPYDLKFTKKHDQRSTNEAVVKKLSKARVKKTKVQKKIISLNDSSIGVLLRKLLVVLKG